MPWRLLITMKHSARQHNALCCSPPLSTVTDSVPLSTSTSCRAPRAVFTELKYPSSVAQNEVPFGMTSRWPKLQHNELKTLYVSWVLGAFSLSQNKSMSSTVAKRTRRWRNLFWLETNCSSLPIERREPREVRGRAMAGWTRGGLEFLQDRCGRVLSWRNCTSSNSNCFFRNSCMLRCVTSGRRCWTRTEARRMLVLCEASDPSVHVTLKPPAHNSCIIQCWWVSAIRLCDNIPKPPILRSSSVSSVSVPQAGTPLCAGLLQVLSHRMVGQWNQRNITSHGTFCNRHMGRFAIDT